MNLSSVVKISDSIELHCNVNYSGRWTPVFQCFEDTQDQQPNTSVPIPLSE